MTRSLLALMSVLAAAACTVAVGCSTPDVDSFEGAALGAKDREERSDTGEDPKPSKPKTTKAKEVAPGGTTATTPPEETPANPATPATPAPPKETPQQCFTKCVAPNPAAAAVDTCSNACADGDTECLGNCALDCDATCIALINQCSGQCPGT